MTLKHDEKHHCPLAAVDQRLEDLHRLWHQSQDAYFDPDAFRVAIQSAIQTMRSVSFILQKNKEKIPNFDHWYGRWQEKLGKDSLMVWMKYARNFIEKEGDLNAHSFVRAEIIASYLDNGPKIEVPANLWDTPLQLVGNISAGPVRDHIYRDGIVRIQRRWIENTLPDYELLDAVAIAYGRLSQLVDDAHKQIGLPAPKTTHSQTATEYPKDMRDGRLPCMIGHADARALDVWLATGEPFEFEVVSQKIDLRDMPKIKAKYGSVPEEIYGESAVPEDRLRSIFAAARKVFEKDSYHCTIAFLMREGVPVNIAELRPEEHGHKYLIMRNLAHEVVKHGIDAVILLGETWYAPFDPEKPMMRAADSSNRKELLTGAVVSKLGEPLYLSAEIKRRKKRVSLGPTIESLGGAHFNFVPLYEAWGKPIPPDWMTLPERDGGIKGND